MPEQIPKRADIRQLRIQAKELLRSLQSGETLVDGKQRPNAKLADAQFLIARKYNFDSWPALVEQIELPILIRDFKAHVEAGNAKSLERLLKSKPSLRRHINDLLFAFDSPAVVRAAHHQQAKELLPILVRYGADPNIRSTWWAGGFSALDQASAEAMETLLALGAKLDVHSAAKAGRIDDIRQILNADPKSVNAPGGDGQRPLHVAANSEIAELLLQMGADPEVRDIDHESTPIQYQINNREVVRTLLKHGAVPDIFTAVVLDDVGLMNQILTADSNALAAHVGAPPFATEKSNGGHIYTYLLGSAKTPFDVAAECRSMAVLSELQAHTSPARKLVAAAWLEDAQAVDKILKKHPKIGDEMGHHARSITDAARAGRTETVRLLLKAGVSPRTQGQESGSVLHVACWFGYVEVVKLLIPLVPLELNDSVYGSPPLGWACHGAQNCRNQEGDYEAVVTALLEAGADPNAPANSGGVRMLAQAGQREDIKKILRAPGAV